MLLWFVLACTPSESEPDGPGADADDTGPPADTSTMPTSRSTTASTGHTGTVPDQLPLVSEALDCELPEPSEPPAATVGDLHKVVLSDVVCNDGSPAVAFVRAALDPVHAADFVLQLDGGAFCDSAEGCAARWCGQGPYDARDMSSTWRKTRVSLQGLASSNPGNAFAGWNQVFVPYCSSDMWMGQRRDVPLEGGDVAFRIHFEGARIVDAVLEGLEAGLASDDGEETLPPIATADQVLFAGLSAGGLGVQTHLDAVAERLAPVPVTGLVDAMWSPDPLAVAAAGASDPAFDPGYVDAIEAFRRDLWDRSANGLYDGRFDTSCLADEPDPYLCIEPGVLQRSHLSTPFATHHSVDDPNLARQHLERGATKEAYIQAGVEGLEALSANRPELGVVGSGCTKHTVLGSNGWFLDMTVDGRDGVLSVHDVAVAYLEGTPLVAIDNVERSASTCP